MFEKSKRRRGFDVTVEGARELEEGLMRIREEFGPKAEITALNRIRGKAKAKATTDVWQESKYLPMSLRNKRTGKQQPTGIKRTHISKRVFTSRVTRNRPYTNITGYVRAIPAIQLAFNSRQGVYKVKTIRRKQPGPRAKNQRARIGGVKVGARFLPNMFLQLTHGDTQANIFAREQLKTWKEGYHGWMFKKGDPQSHAREPYDVVRFQLSEAFNRKFPPAVRKVVNDHFAKEYLKALGLHFGRATRKTSK